MKLKIFVIYHKPTDKILKNEVFEPIMAGNALGNKIDSSKNANKMDYLSDDTGDNISSKNLLFNELTAIYWVWKNYEKIGSPENVGFCHYRRFFIFSKLHKSYYETSGDKDILKETNYSNDVVDKLLDSCDFIAPIPSKRNSVRQNYKLAHSPRDIEIVEEIIKNNYKDFIPSFNNYFDGKKAYFHNMFIFKREEFFRYCEWIFAILFQFEKQITTDNHRLYISERLTGVFIQKLIEEGEVGCFLPSLYVVGEKQKFAQAYKETKRNLKNKEMSLLYALKPIIVFFTPKFILKKRREKSA